MAVGHGLGEMWGGTDLVDDDPVTPPGSLPYTFDFTDESDGPFPGLWTFLALDVAAGYVTSAVESLPSSHYAVVDGAALWAYSRSPVSGDVYAEIGSAASPSGILCGPNASFALVFLSPENTFQNPPDVRQLEIIVGLRADKLFTSFVGGRVLARWESGVGWNPALLLEAVRSSASLPLTVLASAAPFETNKAFDHWDAAQRHELVVSVLEDELRVVLDGVVSCAASVPVGGDVNPVIFVRAYDVTAGVFSPRAVVFGLQIRALREEGRYGPSVPIFGDTLLESAQIPTLCLPLRKLLADDIVRRVGSRSFEFVADTVTDEFGIRRRWNSGERVRVVDKYVGQDFSRVVVDLAYERAKHIGRQHAT